MKTLSVTGEIDLKTLHEELEQSIGSPESKRQWGLSETMTAGAPRCAVLSIAAADVDVRLAQTVLDAHVAEASVMARARRAMIRPLLIIGAIL